mmetsp:Transcript_904/g.5684  ORF Transcript_904/g.5684 Transcript_904/m.5684 type:complete len:410 (-) Transcript_904:4319-5548(-)
MEGTNRVQGTRPRCVAVGPIPGRRAFHVPPPQPCVASLLCRSSTRRNERGARTHAPVHRFLPQERVFGVTTVPETKPRFVHDPNGVTKRAHAALLSIQEHAHASRQLLGIEHAFDAIHRIPTLEKHERRQRLDPVLGRELRILFGVDLDHLHGSGEVLLHFRQDGSHHLARSAPRGVKIHEHRYAGTFQQVFERRELLLPRVDTCASLGLSIPPSATIRERRTVGPRDHGHRRMWRCALSPSVHDVFVSDGFVERRNWHHLGYQHARRHLHWIGEVERWTSTMHRRHCVSRPCAPFFRSCRVESNTNRARGTHLFRSCHVSTPTRRAGWARSIHPCNVSMHQFHTADPRHSVCVLCHRSFPGRRMHVLADAVGTHGNVSADPCPPPGILPWSNFLVLKQPRNSDPTSCR